MKNNDIFISDVYFLLTLIAFAIIAVYMGISHDLLIVNIFYLGITLLLLVISYFMGLLPGLLGNLVFIFIQGSYMLYTNLFKGEYVSFLMMFWLFTPLLLSLVVYGMTDRQRKIQSENKHLRMHLSNDTVFDDLTNLRTMNAYQQDAEIFIGTHKRFGIPVSTGIITLRYEDQILNLLSEESKMKLIKEISKVMVASLRENDIIYNISGLNGKPKWAVLLFSKRDGVDIAIERLKKNVEKKLDEKQNLNKYDIQLKIGISEYNNDIKSVNEFIADAMQNQEYDV
ncbi:MAG: GGDEF domain-containing protein [Liquorilactobacillus nagelii]|jgi:GGDEF domain-containing protein|uniref:GGDEF domain-containing protein n=1 Tax=Liquorilactobacillus nagelii TaxID=82688 RepID=UPI00242B3DE1|nr:GGDEF domain-containing protein [Liquorilactobacillus nagelii]MCI1633769.1 GGDEF domain-containing protein [Liquorilactobacillus nagelii]